MKNLLSKISFCSSLFLIMLLVTTFFAPCSAAQAVADNPSECWGVFIGIENFLNSPPTPPVPNAKADQQALYNSFVSVWGTDHCRLLTDTQATKNGIFDAITWLADHADSNDTVFFSVRSWGAYNPGVDYSFYTYNSDVFDWNNDIYSQELADAFKAVQAAGIGIYFIFW